MNVKAKKSLGQHFLVDLNIARKIVGALSGGGEKTDNPIPVLEIGGGMGVLTQFLLERPDIELWGIEIDRESIEYMRAKFPDFAPRLIEGDFLKTDLRNFRQPHKRSGHDGGVANADSSGYGQKDANTDDQFSSKVLSCNADCGQKGGQATLGPREARECTQTYMTAADRGLAAASPPLSPQLKVIGNFPYNISSQIFFKILDNRDLVPEVVGMVQREVAQRIAEPPGSRSYGILSVLLQAWYDIEYLFTVSEGVFSPPPKVKSAVVRLRRNSVTELGCDEQLFVRVVKAAFGQRRKMLRNALRAGFNTTFCGAEHPFFSRRAETLSVSEFVELTNWVAEHATGT